MRVPLLFVTGMPRSGTTLLSTMLGRHSRMHATPETHFFSQCYPTGELDASLGEMRARQVARCLDGSIARATVHTLEGADLIGHTPRSTFEGGLRASLEAVGKGDGDDLAWLVEKTPAHHEHAFRIAAAYPTARLLTIVRDPRAVSASLRRVPWNREPALQHGRRWKHYARIQRELERTLGERYRWIRYEALLEAPEAMLSDLCAWLGVTYEPAMVSAGATPSTFDADTEPWKVNASAELDPSRIFAWRSNLPPADRKLVELGAGDALERLEYEKEQGGWAPGVLLSMGVQVIAYGAHRLLNKWRYWNEKRTGKPFV
ncbi:MAG: sulfotransferase [Bacteroidota bacterium]